MESLVTGLRLTVYGMGIVFLLLGTLALLIALLVKYDGPGPRERKERAAAAAAARSFRSRGPGPSYLTSRAMIRARTPRSRKTIPIP